MRTDKINGLHIIHVMHLYIDVGKVATFSATEWQQPLNICVEVVKGATPATRLSLSDLRCNIGCNTGATGCNNQSLIRVEVVSPATPATRLNLNHLTRNITRNTGATTRNNQPHSVHIQDRNRIGE